MVSCGSEVDEVSKSSSHSFCELDDTVHGLDGSGGQLGIKVGEDAIQVLTNGLGQMAEGTEATARCPTPPPPEFSFGKLAVGVCVNGLESLGLAQQRLRKVPQKSLVRFVKLRQHFQGVRRRRGEIRRTAQSSLTQKLERIGCYRINCSR